MEGRLSLFADKGPCYSRSGCCHDQTVFLWCAERQLGSWLGQNQLGSVARSKTNRPSASCPPLSGVTGDAGRLPGSLSPNLQSACSVSSPFPPVSLLSCCQSFYPTSPGDVPFLREGTATIFTVMLFKKNVNSYVIYILY